MSSKKLCSLMVGLGLLLPAFPARAAVETNTVMSLKSSAAPVATAVSADGRWFFVLTAKGQVEIYDGSGVLKDTIKLEAPADHLAVSATGEQLYLTDKASAATTVLAVSFVQEIDTAGAPSKGPEKAPVVVALFSDFQCPYCARVNPLLDQVLQEYPTEVKVVFKNFPLQSHKFALPAAIAALAAHRQGKFWEMHDKIFANSSSLGPEKFTEFAKAIGLNMEKFDKDMSDPTLQMQVKADLDNGIKADVRGTPTLFVNGRRVNERSVNGIKALIDAELKKAKKPE